MREGGGGGGGDGGTEGGREGGRERFPNTHPLFINERFDISAPAGKRAGKQEGLPRANERTCTWRANQSAKSCKIESVLSLSAVIGPDVNQRLL